MCESDIIKIVACRFSLNINEFDVSNEFINFKNITLIKIMYTLMFRIDLLVSKTEH